MLNFTDDFSNLQKVDRSKYIEVYKDLGDRMFADCDIPTVGDFANVAGKKNSNTNKSKKKIEQITSFTGNTDSIMQSIKRKESLYTEEESDSFMKKVIASNVNDITESGYFYKKLIASCDNMKINLKHDDCGSAGEELDISDLTEDLFNFKIRTNFVMEYENYAEDFTDFKEFVDKNKLKTVHVRNFLTCEDSMNHKSFCKKCAGLYRRSKETKFIPANIGVYSTLMITEHATQASLDSMNNGRSASLNELLEEKLEPKDYPDYDFVKEKINQIIDLIGNIGVMSKYYQVAMLSRFYRNSDDSYTPVALASSFNKQGDKLGKFIYSPTESNLIKLLSSKESSANSLKSRIMFDIYE